MGLFTASLNSGSNGNCYYVGNEHEGVLIDAGISCRETEQRMKRLELSMRKIKAIFITHEHSDHIGGVKSLSKKYQLPVYVTGPTLVSGRLTLRDDLVLPFTAYQPIEIGSLTITAFPKFHDAADPHSFIISGNGVTVGVFTDIGRACENLIRNFKQCHAVFFESNYDEDMLETGGYPYVLKRRIRGGFGHLSNREAAAFFGRHRPPFMSHVFLSHLSRNNNTPELAMKAFAKVSGNCTVMIVSRYEESAVHYISGNFFDDRPAEVYPPVRVVTQLKLW